MPMAIPLVIAAAEAYAGAAALAAATTIAAEVMAGAMIAGAAMTAVGTLTGNAKLTKIGGVVGAVGGIGSAALSLANAAGAAAPIAGEAIAPTAIDAGAAVDATTANVPTFAADGAQSGTMGSLAGTPGSTSAAGAAPGLVNGNSVAGASTTPNPVQNLVTSDTAAPPVDSSLDGAPNLAGTDASPSSGLAPNNTASTVMNAPTTAPGTVNPTVTQTAGTQATGVYNPNMPQTAGTGGFADPTGGSFNNPSAYNPGGMAANPTTPMSLGDMASATGKFINDNKVLVNTAGGVVNGAMKNASDRNSLKQQAEIAANTAKAARDRYNASLQGLAMPTYQAPTTSKG